MIELSPTPRATNQELRTRAARRGQTVFDSPIECRSCGDHSRYVTSNQCVRCTKSRGARRHEEIARLLKEARDA